MKISVIIPAFNSQETIGKTIKAILDQEGDFDLEVVVVDDGSRDGTKVIINELMRKHSRVHYYYQENAGPAAARNLGAEKASGEIVAFTDADCIPQKKWIKKMVEHLDDPRVGAVAGSYGIANPGNLLARCIFHEIIYRHHNRMGSFVRVLGSYNFCMRKKIFMQIKGFNNSYPCASGEDNDLSYKILKQGYKIFFQKDALVDHYHTESLMKYLKEQYRHGFWRVKMYFDFPHMSKGDDYTFWKDIYEIPLSFFICGLLFFQLFGLNILLLKILKLILILLIIIELIYSFKMMPYLKECLFFSFVMMMRAFIRAIGFVFGNLFFLVGKRSKNKVKNLLI